MEELNKNEFGINIEKILKIFTNLGITTNNIGNNFGEIIMLIKSCEIRNNIILLEILLKKYFLLIK